MKKLIVLFIGLMQLFCLTACGSNSPSNRSLAETMKLDVSESDLSSNLATVAAGKTLVVYYSATGSTERVANVIATAAGWPLWIY